MSYHEEVREAVRMTWNNESEEAEKILGELKERSPRAALEYAHLKMLEGGVIAGKKSKRESLLRYAYAETLAMCMKLGGKDYKPVIRTEEEAEDEDRELTEKEMEALEKKSEQDDKRMLNEAKAFAKQNKVDVSPEWELECDCIQAEALFMRGFYQVSLNAYFKGGLRLRKSWKMYQTLLKKVEGKFSEELVDLVKWGAGLFYLLLSLLPVALTKILAAVGFKADKEIGQRLLGEVWNHEGIKAPYAGVIMCMYYALYPSGLSDFRINLNLAKPILEKSTQIWPNNSYYYLLNTLSTRKEGETEIARESIEKCIKNSPSREVPHLFYFLEADTLYIGFNFEEVLARGNSVFEHFQEKGETFDMSGVLCLEIAAALWNLGRHDEVDSWLQKSIELGNPKNKQDGPAIRLSKRFLSDASLKPLIGVSIFYFMWRNLHHMRVSDVEKVDELLQKAIADIGSKPSNECKALIALFQAVIDERRGNREKALETLNAILSLKDSVPKESPAMPYIYYELAEMLFHNKKFKDAETLLKIGSKLKGDGNETLTSRYKLAIDQARKAQQNK